MKCDRCETQMVEREGRHGDFYFCPNQRNCGKKTITKRNSTVTSGYVEVVKSPHFNSGGYSVDPPLFPVDSDDDGACEYDGPW